MISRLDNDGHHPISRVLYIKTGFKLNASYLNRLELTHDKLNKYM